MTFEGISELKEIYRSKNSIVWAGTYTKNGKKVAVKMLNDDFPSSSMIARFHEEAELSARFDIEGVRKVYEKRKEGNKPVLVMEYFEGAPLQKMLEETGRLDIKRFLDIAIAFCEVLGRIHQNNIVHKDINPRNLLIGEAGEVCIIDFGIASLHRREVQRLEAPEKLEGTLAYISPEQTGRVNHSVDARSDLYSLGVTFYEALTGILPFETDNAMELVHSHIAKIPLSPTERDKTIPLIISKIVMKVLAKSVEDRYQTAEGMKQDLQRCLKAWTALDGMISGLDFPLGTLDFNTSFQIPEKLYGREHERQQLLDAFASTEAGGLATLVVGGLSGIGKTALIRELYKPVTEKRSYFLSGKFEQFQRDVPYSAIIQAVDGFVQQLLGESDRRLEHWRREILDALGSNAGVLTELIPSLALIIGSQPAPVPLPPVESQNRFNRVFQKFFKDLGIPKHSLVLFIDDWQWADLPSLHLLKGLMTDMACKYLLFIAAYRSNEVDVHHPFMKVVEDIRASQTPLGEIQLSVLETPSIIEMLEDTFGAKSAEIKGLAQLIRDKTSGNPFFVTQFLQNLYEQGHILYDYSQNVWRWDLANIQQLPLSSNVLDLMASRLSSLQESSLALLRLASCIGNAFSLKLLAGLAGITQIEARARLSEALEQGLILPNKGNLYALDENDEEHGISLRFLHDRVEQAVNQTIAPEVYAQTQWRIGKAILGGRTIEDHYIQDNLFELVNHLNNGRQYAQTDAEHAQLAELNYRAGKKAKRSNAYSAAQNFFKLAIAYFGENFWEKEYDKAFDLYKEAAEAAFLGGEFDMADMYLEGCLQNAQNKYDEASAYKIKIAELSGQGKYEEAVLVAIKAVALFGVDLPNEVEKIAEAAEVEMEEYFAFERAQGIAALGKLRDCTDKEVMLVMGLLGLALDCAVIAVPDLFGLVVMKMNNLTIKHGLSANSPAAMVFTAVIYGSNFKDFKKAHQISTLAKDIAESRSDTRSILPKVYHIYAYFSYLKSPLSEASRYERKAYEVGLEVGDFVYGAYGIAVEARFHTQISLVKGKESSENALAFLLKSTNVPIAGIITAQLGYIKFLQKEGNYQTIGDKPTRIICGDFDDELFMAEYEQTAPLLAAIYVRYKLQAFALLELFEEAWRLINDRAKWVAIMGGIDMTWRSEYYFFVGMVAAERAGREEDIDKRQACWAILQEAIDEIAILLDLSDNVLPIHKILIAERARIEGDRLTAQDGYDDAAQAAEILDMPQYAGIAAEKAALFYIQHQKYDVARVYLQKALYAYGVWGATAKVEQIREKHKEYLGQKQAGRITNPFRPNVTIKHDSVHTTTYGETVLDLLSVMKASQAISQEIRFDLLVKNMVLVLMENAGAERALLIQEKDGDLLVAAETKANSSEVISMDMLPLSREEQGRAALSIIRQAYRRQETIVTNNAKKDSRFAMDLYVQHHDVKSILCLPILHQGKVRMVMYMEHNQLEGAFTSDRVEVLNLLSSQAAISMENAMLYDTMEQKVAERTAELERKNYNIMASLKYALRMQQAILPTDAELRQITPDYFILYLPKDIVSGDFYWYAQVRNKHIIAAIDCTGHGVPGAFMSMIANTLLDEIVNQKETVVPAEILELLHKGVGIALNQDKTNNNDGMDMTLCALEKLEEGGYELISARAKNVMYYVQDGVFAMMDADRRSIGGEGLTRPFTNRTLRLKAGDVFYLATDGYTDQSGGYGRSAFTKKRLMDLMQTHWQKKMSDQQDIFQQALLAYQGANIQRDDVTLMGFRLI